MKRTILTIAILFFIAATGKLYSQDPATAYDLSQINKVIDKLYTSLTFKKNEAPAMTKLKDIFYGKGMLINNNTGQPKK